MTRLLVNQFTSLPGYQVARLPGYRLLVNQFASLPVCQVTRLLGYQVIGY